MFAPEEIIFAPTSRCNLGCAHCHVRRSGSELDAAEAIAFMGDCRSHGIELLGFSGGEPFLRPDFLVEVSRAALRLDMRFDRLMTNGVFFRSREELEEGLESLYEAGFDGTFGLSVDSYHGQEIGKLADFVGTVFRVWGRKDCVEIASVRSAEDGRTRAMLASLAEALGGSLEEEGGEALAILEPPTRRKRRGQAAEGEELSIRILSIPYSASAEEGAWDSGAWFEEDFCAGPGNVFYIHPDGSVAACCGFANENPELRLGRIDEGYEPLMVRAASSPMIEACYVEGLAATRAELEAAGLTFPGATADQCFFCDYLCKKGLLGR
jgi:hypothetical protein